jgi:hypothetical protein
MAQSKPKSKRGGTRPGAGRKSKLATKLREDFNAVATGLLIEWLPEILGNLKAAADGFKTRNAEGVVYEVPPSVPANIYLADRLLGRPRQAVEHSGKDGAPIPIVICLPDNGRDTQPADLPAQLEAPGGLAR